MISVSIKYNKGNGQLGEKCNFDVTLHFYKKR